MKRAIAAMVAKKIDLLWLTLAAMVFTTEAWPCSVSGVISNVDLVSSADVVVRASAVEYVSPPGDPSIRTTGVPDLRIRFKVIEIVRGPAISNLVLPGYLVNRDDFNDREPPYTFVRPGGRAGSCFANSYRADGQFLLFLKKTKAGEFTVNWSALAPVNEQLHSDDDPWLTWVREQARKIKAAPQR
jgi:hypothetical protein